VNIRFRIAWLALLVAGGCAMPDVRTVFDPAAEFAPFRSFAYLGTLTGDLLTLSGLLVDRN
jgi:hypothetical protein